MVDEIKEMETIKIVIVGDGCCGKTALLMAMMHPDFKRNLEELPGYGTVFDDYAFTMNFHEFNTNVAFNDTSGNVISSKSTFKT